MKLKWYKMKEYKIMTKKIIGIELNELLMTKGERFMTKHIKNLKLTKLEPFNNDNIEKKDPNI